MPPAGVNFIINVRAGRTGIENRVSNLQIGADIGLIVDAAAVVGGRVAAKSAVGDVNVPLPDSAASQLKMPPPGRIAAKSAVGDRQRRASLGMPPPVPRTTELPLIVLLLTVSVALPAA